MEVQENPLRNVLKEAELLSKGWFCWLMKGMMRSLKISKMAKNSSQNVCLG
jgi:protein involved in temperature-dependent protein secretion